MKAGAFGIRWFWWAVLGLLSVTVVVAAVGVVLDQQVWASAAERDAAQYTPPPATVAVRQTAAFIGDSYTAGAGADAPAKRWSTLVAGAEGWLEVNDARGGTGYLQTAEQGQGACGLAVCPNYAQMISAVAKAKPDIVVVSGGRNDVVLEDGRVHDAIDAFYPALRKALPKSTIYVVAPVWDYTAPPSELERIQSYVRSAAAKVGAAYLEIGEPLDGHADWTVADHVHPNDQGHAAIAAAVEKALRKSG